jgi:hypothetical protein
MTLLDRFRRRPQWESLEPEARAEAVRQMAAGEQETFAQIGQTDADPRVRRAAVRRLATPGTLEACAGDSDEGVRVQVQDALLGLALGPDAGLAESAVKALRETRHLVTLARTAPLQVVRRAALERIDDARALATIAKTAEDSGVRLGALKRVQEATLLLEVACKSEHKDVVVAAVERLEGEPALREVTTRARNKAAARRAQARLDELAAAAVSLPASGAVAQAAPATETVDEASAQASPVTQEVEEEVHPSAELETTCLPEPAAGVTEPTPDVPVLEAATPVTPASGPEAGASEPHAHVAEPVPDGATGSAAPSQVVPPREASGQDRPETRRTLILRCEDLCGRLEGLTKSERLALADVDAALREARSLQRDAAGLPGRLRHRLHDARTALFARAQELREAEEWGRWINATVQEELCGRLEGLGDREDLERVARELKECDARWAEARLAPREQADALRQRYQAARAKVKARLDAYFSKRMAEEAANLKLRLELCVQAESLAQSTDWLKAAEEFKALQARWKQIGPAPRRQAEVVWKRFRSACDRFFSRREEDLKQRKAAWAANLARKEALCVQAEALASATDWDAGAAELRKLQAEWKGIGPVQWKKSDAIWQRFRTACDAFFERYRRRDELAQAGLRQEREAICAELEGLLPGEGAAAAAPEGLAGQVQALQARLRQGSPLPAEPEAALQRRFQEARGLLVVAFPEAFRGTDLDPDAARVRKEKLCARVEALLASGPSEPTESLSGPALARRLQEALAGNAIGGAAEAESRRRAEVEDVQAAQAAWKRLAAVPGEAGAALEERFSRACSRFFETRRGPSRPPRREVSAR